ncbi:hypothetical protein E1B28_003992 [Marasmius oreades]|uniref:Uncharacterized protein n=1 Tax=Marasmius oreades TaxID=181124 RepID=A0A9P7UXP5_9AGAR|nr:uncharacterized protein E1B28_003992 [Marasmius oreades]KAG7096572.1 hypothetical protein E1B28_003992 [Marasmius oreades]
MNRPPEMMRQGGMPQMLGLAGGPFMNPQQTGLPPGSNQSSHPPMGMLTGSPSNSNNRYLQQPGSMLAAQQPRHMAPRPGQNGPPMNLGAVPGQMNNMNMGGLNFPPNMMPGSSGPTNQIRRVNSQSSMNPGTMGLGMGQSMGNPSMGMGMNPQNLPPNGIRQVGQPLPGQQPQSSMRGHMGPDGTMSMNRPNTLANQNMNNIGRPTAMPLMGSLNPPQPSLAQTGIPGGLPPHRGEFPNSLQPQLSSSPRPTPNMSMAGPGSSQSQMNRRTPDNNMFMPNYGSNPNFPQGSPNRISNGYPFGGPSSPPNQIEMSQSLPNSLGNTPNSASSHPTFTMTPAQKLEQMHPGESYGPFGMPPRQNGVSPHVQQSHNPSHTHHPSHRPPSSQQHHSPSHASDPNMNMYPTRPQSQPQNNPVGRPPSSHTPRPTSLQSSSQHLNSLQPQQHPPPNSSGLHQPTRIPSQNSGPSSQSLPQTGLRPPSSGGLGPSASTGSSAPQSGPSSQQQPLAIAPRPPQASNAPQQHLAPQQQQHASGAPHAEPSPRDEPSPPSAPAGPSQSAIGPGAGMQGPPPPGYSMMRPGQLNSISSMAPSLPHPHAVGHGQGLLRLMQFSGVLANDSKTKLQLCWWEGLVRDFFTPKAIMKYTLWKDNQRAEAKVFEIGVPVLPRFFLVTAQSGVKSMTLTLDGARERIYDYGHAVVECVSAIWTYRFSNGYTVALKGPMTVHVVLTAAQPPNAGGNPHQAGGHYYLKFENFEFEARSHEKYIALEAIIGLRSVESPKMARGGSGRHSVNGMPTSGSMDSVVDQQDEDKKWEEPRITIERGIIPGEPVNAFGIPQATMRCLELSDSCADMADLITFSADHNLGPLEALRAIGLKLRDSIPHFQASQMMNGYNNLAQGMNTPTTANFPLGSVVNMPSTNLTSPAITLYSPAPPSITNPNSMTQTPSMASAMSSPQNAPASAQSSPRKQHKTIPQPIPSGSNGPGGTTIGVSGAATSSTPGGSTPSMAPGTLKRKNPDNETQTKRPQRRRKAGGS